VLLVTKLNIACNGISALTELLKAAADENAFISPRAYSAIDLEQQIAKLRAVADDLDAQRKRLTEGEPVLHLIAAE